MIWLQPIVIKIVKSLAFKPSYVLELSREHNISAPHIMRTLHKLFSYGILLSKKDLNKKIYKVNYKSILSREILRLSTIIMLEEKAFLKLGKICQFGIYGSYSTGYFDHESDLDLWVYNAKDKATDVRACINNIETLKKIKINVLYLDKKKLELLKKDDSEFYLRLRFQSITNYPEVFNGES